MSTPDSVDPSYSTAMPTPTREPHAGPTSGDRGLGPLVVSLLLLSIVAALSIYLANTWLVSARVDLTEQGLYSLTDGTEALLAKMGRDGTKPVDITLYFSETTGKTLPKFIKEFITYEQYLRNLLREYERGSGGRLRLHFVDPIPDSDEAQRAADLGLEGKLINQDGDLFYFGLALVTETGSRQILPFLWPAEQENVEYEISKSLHGLLWSERSSVGVLSSLEVFGSGDDPYMAQMLAAQGRQPKPRWVAVQLLEELYDVEQVGADSSEIDALLDLLLVIHPKDLPTKTVAAIDRFIGSGGNAILLVDPYALDDRPPQDPQQPWAALQYEPSSDLPELFRAWGIERVASAFAADLDLAVRRPVQQFGPAESVIVDLLYQGDALNDGVDASSPIFRGLADLRFLLAGVLQINSPEPPAVSAGGADGAANENALEIRPLVQTTEQGGELNILPGFGNQAGLAYTDLNNPAKLRDQYQSSGRQVLAISLSGRFPSAFPEGVEFPDRGSQRPPGLPPGVELPPPEGGEMIRVEPLPDDARAEATVLVFADVDFISDQIAFVQSPFGILQAANDNHRVLLNAVDLLLGSRELMAIRSTKRLDRPFELFNEIEARAERDTLDREREIRADIETFQDQLRAKQGEITSKNASLFQKRIQDEVADLNERIAGANRELREIRKSRRQAIDAEESSVRFAVMGWMPILVLGLALFRAWRRR